MRSMLPALALASVLATTSLELSAQQLLLVLQLCEAAAEWSITLT